MSVNPSFGGQTFIPEMIEKARRLKEMTDLPIEVDGGITERTAPLMAEAGARVLVAGLAVYKGDPLPRCARSSRPGDRRRGSSGDALRRQPSRTWTRNRPRPGSTWYRALLPAFAALVAQPPPSLKVGDACVLLRGAGDVHVPGAVHHACRLLLDEGGSRAAPGEFV
jgi:Ribulose-phosphate 3 epimerase family